MHYTIFYTLIQQFITCTKDTEYHTKYFYLSKDHPPIPFLSVPHHLMRVSFIGELPNPSVGMRSLFWNY